MDHLGDDRSTIAQCVLIAVGRYHGDVENSWSKEQERYLAKPTVSLWYNGREQGYFLSVKKGEEQLNIFFFEHRNSDDIIIKYFIGHMEQQDIYQIDDLPDGVYKDKYHYDMSFRYNQPIEAAEAIQSLFEDFYEIK